MRRFFNVSGIVTVSSQDWKESTGESLQSLKTNVMNGNTIMEVTKGKMKLFVGDNGGIKAKCWPLMSSTQITETTVLMRRELGIEIDEDQLLAMEVSPVEEPVAV